MNWNKPILVGWKKSPKADFIRRHKGLFIPSSRRSSLITPGYLVFVVAPFLVLLIFALKMADWVVSALVVVFFGATAAYMVLIQSATEQGGNDDQAA